MPKQEENGRKRAAEDDLDAGSTSRRNKRLAKPMDSDSSLKSLPREIFDRILGEVALLGGERRAARDLTSVERVSSGFQKALSDSPAASYRQSLSEAGKAAKRSYRMLPSGRFPDAGPVGADEYIDMVGPGMHLLSADQQSKIIDKVLAIQSLARRADTVNRMASFLEALSEEGRSRLLESALDLIEEPDGTHVFPACKAAAKLYVYRTPAQELRMVKVRSQYPMAASIINDELEAIGRKESTSTAENTPSPSADVPPAKQRVRTAAEDAQTKLRQADAARIELENRTRDRVARGP